MRTMICAAVFLTGCNLFTAIDTPAYEADQGADVPRDTTLDVAPDIPRDTTLDVAPDIALPDVPADTSRDADIDLPLSVAPEAISKKCWRKRDSCEWTETFEFRRTLFNLFSDGLAANATFSPDACDIYYAIYDGSDSSIWRVSRTQSGGSFGPAELMQELNQPIVGDDGPSIGPDGLEFFFTSSRSMAGVRRVHRATRSSRMEMFGVPMPIPSLNEPNTVGWEPRIAPHGLRLYYARKTEPEFWIYMAERPTLGAEFGPPTRVDLGPLGMGMDATNRPSVTQDERVLVGVQQSESGGTATRRPFYSTRPNWNAPWSAIKTLPREGFDVSRDVAVSPDGCEILIRSLDQRDAALQVFIPL